MSDFRGALKKAGYDQVEAYFHQKDLELIEKMREAAKATGSPPLQEGAKVIQLETASFQSATTDDQKKAA